MTPRRVELARGVGAAVVLAAVVVGVPVLLVGAVGWPLPRELPSLAELGDVLGAERAPEATTLWKVLAALAWVAWAQVVASVALEAAAVVRGGLAATLPGLGLAQGVAAPLVTAIALAWPAPGARPAAAAPAAMTATTPPPPAAPPATSDPEPVPGLGTATRAPAATVDHVVVRRDTLWDLAERYLGDGALAAELFELNRGRPQPDGSALSDPGLLRPGWVLSIPAEPGRLDPGADHVVLRRGDTLWGLAEEHLGDGRRYPELVELNAGRPQPDGATLVDPDAVEAGWVLRLPLRPPPAAPAPSPAPPVAPPQAVETDAPESPAPPEQPEERVASGSAGAASPDAERPAPDADAEAERVEAGEDDERPVALAPVGLIGGGVATAGLVVLLDRRRRGQQRRRLRGRRLPPLGPGAAGAEPRLRAGADVDTATRIDLALRAAAAGTNGLPPLRRVEAGPDTVTLVVDSDVQAPDGFVDDAPGRWCSGVDDAALAALAAPARPPVPCLAPLGRDEAGVEILVDLAGVVSVVGEPASTTALLRALAAAAATSPWSEGARVLLVGLDDLRLPGVEAVASLGEALGEAERHLGPTSGAADGPGTNAPGAGAPGPDGREPLMVFSAEAPSEADFARLSALAAAPGHGVAVVVTAASSPPLGRALVVGHDGVVTFDDRRLRARQLDHAEARLVDELLEHATLPAVAPAAAQPAPPPAPKPPGRRRVGALAELLGEVDVLVRVLGPVEAVRLGPDGETRLDIGKQKALEAIAYLALRETPVDREELQAALWPAGTNSAKTFQNVVWAARKALGADRDGADLLPDPVEGRYGSNPRLVTDYGLFHELVTRAEETAEPAEAAELLAEALSLVQGEPFVGVGRNYVWVAPHAGMVVAQVVDAAEELAEVRLAGGDWRRAEWAARQGLRVFPCDERLYRVLMRCAHAAGSRAGVQRAFDELLAKAADPDGGVEPEDTVHEETVSLLEQLSGSGVRSRRVNA